MMEVKKVVVLGIDGGTYKVLDRLIELGAMPNLALLFKKGTRANLLSTLPPMTGTAWASFATGKNPGKHGCFDFFLPTKTLNDQKLISSEDIKGKTFYEILERAGKKCALINLPLSWPPRLKKGIIIGGLLSPENDFFFPKDLDQEIPELNSYQLFYDLFHDLGTVNKRYLQELGKIEKTRFIVAQKLFKKDWDFFFLLFSSIDWLQHRQLKELLSSSLRKNSPLLSIYKDIDNYLGWFINNLSRGTILFLLSDHGFKLYSGRFYPNYWLEQKGDLMIKSGLDDKGRPHELVKKKIRTARQKGLVGMGLKRLAMLIFQTPSLYQAFGLFFRVVNRLFPGKLEGGLSDAGDSGLGVGLKKTLAFSPLGSFGQIYLNRKARFDRGVLGEKKAEELKERLVKQLRNLTDTETGKKAVKAAYPTLAVYSWPRLKRGPDIILASGDYWIKPSLSSGRTFSHQALSCHDQEGIFCYFDPVGKRKKINQVTLYDLAPTILHLLGVKVPKGMDGKIIR